MSNTPNLIIEQTISGCDDLRPGDTERLLCALIEYLQLNVVRTQESPHSAPQFKLDPKPL